MKTIEKLRKENPTATVFKLDITPTPNTIENEISKFARINNIAYIEKPEYNYTTYKINGLNVMLRYSKNAIDIWCKKEFKGAVKFAKRNQFHKKINNLKENYKEIEKALNFIITAF